MADEGDNTGEASSTSVQVHHDDDEISHPLPPRGRSPWSKVPRRSRRNTVGDASRASNASMDNIPLVNLHRRQSRDNSSLASGRPTKYQLVAQEDPSLDEDDVPMLGSPHGRPSRYTMVMHNIYDFCRRRLCCGLILTLLVLAVLAVVFAAKSSSLNNQMYTYNYERSNGSLGIVLHPEDHIDRKPGVVDHIWTITSEERAPDGVQKKVYLINGEFPGPMIECRPGDELHITVLNALSDPADGISIHWHGLSLKNANEMDGASGLTQCPIPPGKSFTYKFKIEPDSAGTFWYHAHSAVQRGDGMYGGLIVHDKDERGRWSSRYGYHKDMLLLIGDWYHRDASKVLDWYMSPRGFKAEPSPDSLLINGAGQFPCDKALKARPLDCAYKWTNERPGLFEGDLSDTPVRLRVVNVGSIAGFTLATNRGTMTPLTLDGGHPIAGHPSNDVGILYPGERLDVLLQRGGSTAGSPGVLSVSLDPGYTRRPNEALQPQQFFPFFESKDFNPEFQLDTFMRAEAWEPRSKFHLEKANASLTTINNKAYHIPEEADKTLLINVKTEQLSRYNNKQMGFVNRTSWSPQRDPPLPLRQLQRTLWDENQFFPFILWQKSKPLWVDMIVNNLDDDSHPFHLHGHNFYVVASHSSTSGWGSYSPYATTGDASIKPQLNRVDPLKKDTVNIPRRGYVILRFQANNPGIWMFHCHVLFHMASGMSMGLFVADKEEYIPVKEEKGGLCGRL